MGYEFYSAGVWQSLGFSSLEDFLTRSYEGGFAEADPRDLMAQLRTWVTTPVPTAEELRQIEVAAPTLPASVALS